MWSFERIALTQSASRTLRQSAFASVATASLRDPASLADLPILPYIGVRRHAAHPCGKLKNLKRQPDDIMPPVIRIADASDLPALASLIERYWEFERIDGFDAARVTALLTDLFKGPDRGQIWIAQQGGQPVGYLLIVYLFSLEHGGMMAEIDEFLVIPERRSLNIGAALLDAATAAMARRGIEHIQLQLGKNNLHGKRFYEKHGFQALSGYGLLHKTLPAG